MITHYRDLKRGLTGIEASWLRFAPDGSFEVVFMMTNPPGPGFCQEVYRSGTGDPQLPASGEKRPESIGRRRLEALRSDLDEGNNQWPDYMAAMIDEDFRQLMKDFGLL